MKEICFHLVLSALLLLVGLSTAAAQTEYGIRPLFFQNDFYTQDNEINGVVNGNHAGEWQLGVSRRRYFSSHFSGRLEANMTYGRYAFSQKRFAFLNFPFVLEWRVSKLVFLGCGPFVDIKIKAPYDPPQNIGVGLLATAGIRYKMVEIQCRAQRWVGYNKFTLGVGLDYFFGAKKSK